MSKTIQIGTQEYLASRIRELDFRFNTWDNEKETEGEINLKLDNGCIETIKLPGLSEEQFDAYCKFINSQLG